MFFNIYYQNEDKYEYDLKIGDDNYLVIKALPKIDTGKVEVTGNLDLVNGSIIKIGKMKDIKGDSSLEEVFLELE